MTFESSQEHILNKTPELSDLNDEDGKMVTINVKDYINIPEPKPHSPGGHPANPRVVQLAIWCYKWDDPKKATVYCCVGTNSGCQSAWETAKWSRQHVLNHTASCEHIPHELREQLDGGLAKTAPSAKLLPSSGASVAPVSTIPCHVSSKGPSSKPSCNPDPCQPSVYNLAKKT
ncbi:hypothetical protein V8B97DRAFT_1917193 [Scleroderma yunnanense]